MTNHVDPASRASRVTTVLVADCWTARNRCPPGRRGQAPRPLGPPGSTGQSGATGAPSLLDSGGALYRRAAAFHPTPYPSETYDRQSWAILRPVAFPETPFQNDRQWRLSAFSLEPLLQVKAPPCVPRDEMLAWRRSRDGRSNWPGSRDNGSAGPGRV